MRKQISTLDQLRRRYADSLRPYTNIEEDLVSDLALARANMQEMAEKADHVGVVLMNRLFRETLETIFRLRQYLPQPSLPNTIRIEGWRGRKVS
ncbi:MAG: hypothetical protein HY820_23095 [Acidobacteria bacterium]|nr:hypothetical protein [Acidobacteriota bacterium]